MKTFTLLMIALGFGAFATAQNASVNGCRNCITSNNQMVQRHQPASPSTAAVVFADDMNGDNTVSGLYARGYHVFYRGTGPQGAVPPFFQGNPPVSGIVSFNGPDTGYVASNYQSVTGLNDIDNWLVLPAQNLTTADTLSFYSQSPANSIYPDSIRVMYNAAGDTLPEATTWVELGRFKSNILGVWELTTWGVPTASATGIFAIRYAVAEGGPSGNNSDYVGIDQITIFNQTASGTFDSCAFAVDITSGFGGAIGTVNTLGPYDNTGATVSPTDPSTGWECFGEPNGSGSAPELNNTVWFTFTGDGNNYFVESNTSCPGVTNAIDDGDTQFALYTGTSCTSLTPIKCNEDGPSSGPGGAPPYPAGFSFGTTAGQTYYLLVDGFSFNGAVSDGEFCIAISRQTSVACTSSTVTAGTYTVSDTILCPGDTATINVTGAVAPNQGSFYGISMMISNAPLTGSTDPLNDPSFIAAYSVVEPVPATFSRRYINDGSLIDGTTLPWGTYYWTPVVFGNAIPTSPAVTFLTDLTLDPSCTITGTSVAIQVLSGSDPLCNTQSIAESNGPDHGIINLYPVPVRDQLNLVYHSLSNERVRLEVKDQLGRLVKEYSSQVINGKNILAMETSELSRGVYFITVIGENSNFNARFTKE